MKLKKANAVLGLLTIVMLIIHAGYQMVAYVKFVHNEGVTMALAAVILVFMLIHMILALVIVTIAGEGTDITGYPRDNMRTIIQRASAIGIMVFLIGHLYAYDILTSSSAGLILSSIIQILFFGMIFIHIATSFSNGLITLGLLQSETKKKVLDRVIAAMCSVAFAAACIITIRTYAMLAAMQN